MFGEKRYNLVLLDRNLPDLDGTEVARRIRNLESDGPQAVLLAVTAYCTEEDRALCLAAGMDAFVGKPLTPDKLRRVLLAAGRKLLAAASVDAPREPAPAAKLDLSLLTYLSNGSDQEIADQVQRFLATLVEAEAELTSAIGAADFSRLRVQAHRLHGQAQMVGGTALAEAALRLEQAAESLDVAGCSAALAYALDEVHAITAAMRHRSPAAVTA